VRWRQFAYNLPDAKPVSAALKTISKRSIGPLEGDDVPMKGARCCARTSQWLIGPGRHTLAISVDDAHFESWQPNHVGPRRGVQGIDLATARAPALFQAHVGPGTAAARTLLQNFVSDDLPLDVVDDAAKLELGKLVLARLN
jgi:hypothetical protein